ncbi:hypothetical protein Landi51_02917 [Colletotrichum acutatum]
MFCKAERLVPRRGGHRLVHPPCKKGYMKAKSKQNGQFRRLSSSQGYLSALRSVAFILHTFSFAPIKLTQFDIAIQDLLRKLQTDGILDWVQRAGLRAVHLTLHPSKRAVSGLGPPPQRTVGWM